MGIKETNTTAYHPQTGGLVERLNRTLSDMLVNCGEEGLIHAYHIHTLCILSAPTGINPKITICYVQESPTTAN